MTPRAVPALVCTVFPSPRQRVVHRPLILSVGLELVRLNNAEFSCRLAHSCLEYPLPFLFGLDSYSSGDGGSAMVDQVQMEMHSC